MDRKNMRTYLFVVESVGLVTNNKQNNLGTKRSTQEVSRSKAITKL